MNNVKTTRSSMSKHSQNVLVMFLIAAVPLGCYLYLFVIRANLHEVVPGKVYRSAQPSPAQLRKWIRRYGIKTVINLRGGKLKIRQQEYAAANQSGAEVIDIRLKSSSLPTRNSLNKLIQAIETAEQPILIHCRGGVDRAGTASTLAAMAIGKETYDAAKWQAYVPLTPWKRCSSDKYVHISDMLSLYERYCRDNNVNIDDWHEFKQWSAVTDAFGDVSTKHRRNYSYFPKFDKADWFRTVAKLLYDAWPQFSAELVILSVLAVVMYRKLSRNKTEGATRD